MIKAAIFDLDGTLVNSLEDLAISTNYALSKFNFPTHKLSSFNYFVGDGIPKLIERALPENSDEATKKNCLDVFMNYYKEHCHDKTKSYDGIKTVLEALKNNNYYIAVISNKADEMAKQVVENIFGNTFDIVVGKQDGFKAKPDPKLTLKTIKELNLSPKECVFIGDSGMDMKTAVNCNCYGIGALWGFRTREELLQNGADFIAENPSDIIDIIEGINHEQ